MQFITWLQNNSVGVSEAIRQMLYVCMIFGLLNWTESQMGGVLSALGAILAVITSKTTVGAAKVGARIDEAHAAGIVAGETGTGSGVGLSSSVPKGQAFDKRMPAILLVASLAGLSVLPGCASTSGKQRVVAAYQSTQTALAAFQDAERTLYQSKLVSDLTPARHAAISDALAVAFGAQVKVGDALLIWKSGQPAPTALADWFTEVDRVLTEVERLVPSEGRAKLVGQILMWVRAVLDVARGAGVTVPLRLSTAVAQGGGL